jgi:hypothetical protein
MSCFVRLSDYSVSWGKAMGYFRYHEGLRRRYQHGNGRSYANDVENQQRGACAELALCEWKGWPWRAPINTFKNESDLPGGIEVRSKTEHYDYMLLKTREQARAVDRMFVSLTCMRDSLCIDADPMSVWRIDGWELGSVIMAEPLVPDRWNGEAWHFPLEQLQPIESLDAAMEQRHHEPNYVRPLIGAA